MLLGNLMDGVARFAAKVERLQWRWVMIHSWWDVVGLLFSVILLVGLGFMIYKIRLEVLSDQKKEQEAQVKLQAA